jgi:hypothetical protein
LVKHGQLNLWIGVLDAPHQMILHLAFNVDLTLAVAANKRVDYLPGQRGTVPKMPLFKARLEGGTVVEKTPNLTAVLGAAVLAEGAVDSAGI